MANNEPTVTSDADSVPATPPGHDIFTDPALAQTLKEDPFFRFLQANWRQVLLGVGFVLAAVYAQQVFRDTRVAEMERAADIFTRARTEYAQFVSLETQLAAARKRLPEKAAVEKKAEEKKEGEAKVDAATARVTELEKSAADSRRRLEGHLGSLADARSPYREFAGIYKGLLARAAAGDGASLKDVQAAFGVSGGSAALGENPDLATELRASVVARMMLDVPEERAAGWKALADLAAKGRYLRVSAAVSMAQIANSADERAAALKAMEELLLAQPEHGSVLTPEISRLKAAGK